MASLMTDVDALCGLLDDENALLASNSLGSHQEIASRKLRLLRALLGHSKAGAEDEGVKCALGRLREALAANERLLSIHLGAMRSVTSVIIDSIRAEESDCTYQRTGMRRLRPSC